MNDIDLIVEIAKNDEILDLIKKLAVIEKSFDNNSDLTEKEIRKLIFKEQELAKEILNKITKIENK